MSQATLFDDAAPDAGEPAGRSTVRFKVGSRFMFHGLAGQEPSQQATAGSGSVGWIIEVVDISPFGGLGVRCSPDEEVSVAQVGSVPFADATEMVRQGIWTPFAH